MIPTYLGRALILQSSFREGTEEAIRQARVISMHVEAPRHNAKWTAAFIITIGCAVALFCLLVMAWVGGVR